MSRYFVRRVLVTVPLLLGLSIVVFLLIQIAPGDPTLFFIPSGPTDVAVDPALRAQIRRELGLDQPVLIQYFAWFSRMLRGDFGYAFTYHVPVFSLVISRVPATLQLQGAALIVAVAAAIPIGILSATRQHSIVDHVATSASLFGLSLPNFWLALLLILLFSVRLGWLPSGGIGQGSGFAGRLPHLILPVLVLASEYMASYTRFVRSSVLEVLRADFVTTARAKGLSERRVMYRHALRNALLPMVTIAGLSLPRLVSGSIIVESIFAWPGLGRLAYDAVLRRDQPVIMAATLITSFAVILSNLVVDVIYLTLDPRITYNDQT
jgi:peptide/nickel transport system permease protein